MNVQVTHHLLMCCSLSIECQCTDFMANSMSTNITSETNQNPIAKVSTDACLFDFITSQKRRLSFFSPFVLGFKLPISTLPISILNCWCYHVAYKLKKKKLTDGKTESQYSDKRAPFSFTLLMSYSHFFSSRSYKCLPCADGFLYVFNIHLWYINYSIYF